MDDSSIALGTQCKLSGLNSDYEIDESKLTTVGIQYCESWVKNGGNVLYHYII